MIFNNNQTKNFYFPSKKIQNNNYIKNYIPPLLPNQQQQFNIMFFTIYIKKEDIIKSIQTLNWRKKTSFPIVKVLELLVQPKINQFQQQLQFSPATVQCNKQQFYINEQSNIQNLTQYVKKHLEVAQYQVKFKLQEIDKRLSSLKNLPLSQSIYLLKETAIGFDSLSKKFGYFEPRSQMVILNKSKQWKVWINQNMVSLNTDTNKLNEQDFTFSLIKMIQKHTSSSIQSKKFFNLMYESLNKSENNLKTLMEKINEFSNNNKIYIANKVNILATQNTQIKLRKQINLNQQNIKTKQIHNSQNYKVRDSLQSFKTSYSKPYLLFNQTSNKKNQPINNQYKLAISSEFNNSNQQFTQPNFVNYSLTPTAARAQKDIWSNLREKKIIGQSPPKLSRQRFFSPNISLKRQTSKRQYNKNQDIPSPTKLSKKSQSNNQKINSKKLFRKFSQNVNLSDLSLLNERKFYGSFIYGQKNKIKQKIELNTQKANKNQQIIYSPFKTTNSSQCNTNKQSTIAKQLIISGQASTNAISTSGNIGKKLQSNASSHDGLPLTNSYQFQERDKKSFLSNPVQRQNTQKWIPLIQCLFNQNSSIKILKQSVQVHKQKQYFQKQHLKQIQLDLLNKFGRTVDHHEESMQLIQQQYEEDFHQISIQNFLE